MNLRAIVKNAYCKDMIYAKIITQPDAHTRFGIWEGLIWTKNQLKCDVICIPRDTFQRGRRLIKIIIDHAHQTPNHWALWPMENLKLYSMVILVATNGHQHRSFLQIVGEVSDQQNQHTEITRVSTQLAYTRQAMAVGGHRLYGTIAPVTRQ